MEGIKLRNKEIDGSVNYLGIYKEISGYLPENHSSDYCDGDKYCSIMLTEDFYDGRNNTDFIMLSYDENRRLKFDYTYGEDDIILKEVNDIEEFVKESIKLIKTKTK